MAGDILDGTDVTYTTNLCACSLQSSEGKWKVQQSCQPQGKGAHGRPRDGPRAQIPERLARFRTYLFTCV